MRARNTQKIEILSQTAFSLVVNGTISYAYLYWWLELSISIGEQIELTVSLTLLSLIIKYAWRRHFSNRIKEEYAGKLERERNHPPARAPIKRTRRLDADPRWARSYRTDTGNGTTEGDVLRPIDGGCIDFTGTVSKIEDAFRWHVRCPTCNEEWYSNAHNPPKECWARHGVMVEDLR